MFLHRSVILFTGGGEGGLLPSIHYKSHDQHQGGWRSASGEGFAQPPNEESGRYASYWDAFLSNLVSTFVHGTVFSVSQLFFQLPFLL